MQVVFHLGAHHTDEERLVRGLIRARAALAERGMAAPSPGRYRTVLRDALVQLRGDPAPQPVQELILDAACDEERPKRLLFAHDFFLCIPHKVVSGGGFYPLAARKARALANLFPQAQVEFTLGLRNPATLLAALRARIEPEITDPFSATPIAALRWAPVIGALREAVPEARFTLWANEDTPLIWPEVLRAAADAPEDLAMPGDHDVLEGILSRDGLRRLASYLESHPPQSVAQRRRVVAAFLERFALPEAIDMAIDLPGWDHATVAGITAAYEADLASLAQEAAQGRGDLQFLAP